MQKLNHWFFLLLMVGCLFDCSEETEVFDRDLGLDFYPLEIGKYKIYELDSIIYDPAANFTRIDTFTSFIREEIADTLTDNTGNTVYRIERFIRKTMDDAWRIDRVFVMSIDENRAFWVEDNLRFIKLVFPFERGTTWDGNSFFDPTLIVTVAGESIEMFKDWSYEVEDVQSNVEINGRNFEEVVTVNNATSENLIEQRTVTEKYARGIGLVQRELSILDTQCEICCNQDFANCQSLPWEEKAEKGFVLKQRIIEFN